MFQGDWCYLTQTSPILAPGRSTNFPPALSSFFSLTWATNQKWILFCIGQSEAGIYLSLGRRSLDTTLLGERLEHSLHLGPGGHHVEPAQQTDRRRLLLHHPQPAWSDEESTKHFIVRYADTVSNLTNHRSVLCLTTNQRSVLFFINQSEISID